jgi:hypothetical protein
MSTCTELRNYKVINEIDPTAEIRPEVVQTWLDALYGMFDTAPKPNHGQMIIIDDHRLGIFDLMVLDAPDEKIVIGGPYPPAALQFAKRRAAKSAMSFRSSNRIGRYTQFNRR